jgi:hypothetical protein
MSGEPPAAGPRLVNVTADSAPGWLPTVEDEKSATDTAKAYLAASSEGETRVAYAMLADGQKAAAPFDQFSQRMAAFDKQTGAALERRFVKVTWTKDPAKAPGPGVYVAFDLVSRFALAQRSCGYLVLFRPPEGGAFRVAREEINLFTDAEAAKIQQDQSKAAVDAAWARLTANCPNYPSDPLAAESTSPPPIAEDPHGDIGYPTVAAARADLQSRKGVTISNKEGWTIVSDPGASNIWSFVPEGHPAYPAVVRRHVYQTAAGVMMDMKVLCQSIKGACDDLVRAFEELNAQMSAKLKAGSASH